jgi:hypothetical protein
LKDRDPDEGRNNRDERKKRKKLASAY